MKYFTGNLKLLYEYLNVLSGCAFLKYTYLPPSKSLVSLQMYIMWNEINTVI